MIQRTWLDNDSTAYVAVLVDDDSEDLLPPRIVTVMLEISDGSNILSFNLTPRGDVELEYAVHALGCLRNAIDFAECQIRRVNVLPPKQKIEESEV